jgi:PAS domain S-box-containing protein
MENAAEGIHWVAPDGQVLWANNAELVLLGYSAEEYIGQNIRQFHADPDVITDILDRLLAGETVRNYPARVRAKDGGLRHVLINSNGLRRNGELIHTQCFTRDITDLKAAQEAQAFHSAIIESADDAIVGKTLDGIITTWNPGAEKLFGYSATEAIGKPVTILFPPELYNEEPAILARVRRGERIKHYETRRVRKDGTIIDISLTVSPVLDEDGRIIGASKIARDITERKRFEAERKRLLQQERAARSQAEAANRFKDEFLGIVSHELRTPLNAVLGWVNILESRQDEDLLGRAVEVIKRNAHAQRRMIEDLLDVARILQGKMVINEEPVDLSALVNAAIDTVSPAASAKAIRLDRAIDSSVPLISGDPGRLQQVICNLLSNSIKFTPQNGYIEVRLSQVGPRIEFSVHDTGQGIAADFLPHVFDRFAQGDSTMSRLHGGLGIGLAVVKHLVEAHGGTVSADSPGEGLGATFTVVLPLQWLGSDRR